MKKLKRDEKKAERFFLDEYTLVSTDFFFAVVVSFGLGISWLLIANAQSVARQYAELEPLQAMRENASL